MMRPVPRATAAVCSILFFALAASGCVYRMDIQQGNLLDREQVDQVEVGMTRSQVRFLLGTPMVIDSFNADRWDYVYSLRRGHSRTVSRAPPRRLVRRRQGRARRRTDSRAAHRNDRLRLNAGPSTRPGARAVDGARADRR